MWSLITIALAFALGWMFTRAILALSPRYGAVLATENERSMHKGAVPKGGGAALLAAALISATALGPWRDVHSLLFPVTIALAIMCWIDDARTLPRRLRLVVHVAASIICVLAVTGGRLIGVLPAGFEMLIAVVGLAWFINLHNFMDGIDGLAAIETTTIALGYAVIVWLTGSDTALCALALALAGASLGFLVFNWQPARIFLGDVGSIPLGLLTGGLMIDLAVKGYWAAAMILPAYFAADATITLVRRAANGEKLWRAHRSHFYQRAARALGSHAAVSSYVLLCNAALLTAAVVSIERPVAGLAIAAAAVAVILVHFERLAKRAGVRFGASP